MGEALGALQPKILALLGVLHKKSAHQLHADAWSKFIRICTERPSQETKKQLASRQVKQRATQGGTAGSESMEAPHPFPHILANASLPLAVPELYPLK